MGDDVNLQRAIYASIQSARGSFGAHITGGGAPALDTRGRDARASLIATPTKGARAAAVSRQNQLKDGLGQFLVRNRG